MIAREQLHQEPWEELTDGIWRARLEPAGVNVGLIVGDDAALLIDTGSCPEQGAAIRASITDVTDKPLRYVVITHPHWDHWFGAAAFRDVEIVGHVGLADEATRPEQIDSACEIGVDPADIVAPTAPMQLIRAIDLGGRRVELLHGGPAHTQADIFAYVPDADVVFAGDLLEQSGPPSFGPDCDLKNWAQALDVMMGLLNEHSQVVPGHGEPMNHMDSFEQRARIGVIYPTVLDLVKGGVQREQAQQSGEWPYPPHVMVPALDRAYAQVKAAGVDPKRQLGLRSL